MRKFFMGITMLLSINSVHAGDQGFIDFVVKAAHERNFTQCDNSIKKVFADVFGKDIRVNTEFFNDTVSDSLKVSTTYGNSGDSVYEEAEFRRVKNKCVYTQLAIYTINKSCLAYSKEMKDYEYVAETPDFIWTNKKGSYNMILKQVGNQCMVIYTIGSSAIEKQ